MLEVWRVLHKIFECINSLDLAIFHPNDLVAPIEDPQLMRRKNATLVFKQAQDGVVKDMTANMGIDGA